MQCFFNNRKIWGTIAGIIVAVAIYHLPSPDGLTADAIRFLGIFAGALIYLIFDVLPDYVVVLIMSALLVIFKILPINIAFAAFSGPIVWLIIAVLVIGAAAVKSGLMQRMALRFMLAFPLTFKSQSLVLIISGLMASAAIPSITGRMLMIAPFTRDINNIMGYAKKSIEAAGIFLAMFIGYAVSAPLFLSASFLCYAMLGLMPLGVQQQISWLTWLYAMLPWGLIVLPGCYAAILLLYLPVDQKSISPESVQQKLGELGEMSYHEKVTLIVLIACLILWISTPLHGLSAEVVAIGGMCILLAFRIIDTESLSTEVPWHTVLFLGVIVNLALVFKYLGISVWLVDQLGPIFYPLISNTPLFIIVSAVSLYLLQFILVSQMAAVTIFVILISPLAAGAGINPWIPGIIAIASVNIWNVIYQNMAFLTAYSLVEDMVSFRDLVPMSAVYMILSIIGFLVCIPWWKHLGLIV